MENDTDLCTEKDPIGISSCTSTYTSNYIEITIKDGGKVYGFCTYILNSSAVNAGYFILHNYTSTSTYTYNFLVYALIILSQFYGIDKYPTDDNILYSYVIVEN